MNFQLDAIPRIQAQARKLAASIEHIAAEADDCSTVHPESSPRCAPVT